MSDQETVVGDNAGIDSVNSTENPPEKQIALKDHKRAIDDMMAYKKKAQELEAKINELDTARLKEKEDFKSLYERTNGELETVKAEKQKVIQQVMAEKKYSSVYPLLKKNGLMDEAEVLLERESLEDLAIETTSEGRYIVHGKDAFVENFKKKYPFGFKTKEVPKVNSGGNSTFNADSTDISVEKVLEAENLWRKGKITKQDYEKMYFAYSKNRKK